MVMNSPNCTNRHRSGYTCIDLGKGPEECCPNCYAWGADRLLEAIKRLDEKPVTQETLDELKLDMTPEEAEEFMDSLREDQGYTDISPADVGGAEVASFDLKEASFPFEIVFINKNTKEVWHSIHVTGPGVIDIPPGKQHGIKETEVLLKFPDGSVVKSS